MYILGRIVILTSIRKNLTYTDVGLEIKRSERFVQLVLTRWKASGLRFISSLLIYHQLFVNLGWIFMPHGRI